MGLKTEFVEVRVSNRILHVGLEAYPLRMVTRVEPLTLSVRRGPILKAFARRLAYTIVGSAVTLIVAACAMGDSERWGTFLILFGLAFTVVMAWQIIALVRGLGLPDLYVLRVETAGTAHTALVNTNRDLILELAARVVEAIDNPDVEYVARVTNYQVGDTVLGDKYGGDNILGKKVSR